MLLRPSGAPGRRKPVPILSKSAPKKAKKERMHDEMHKFKHGSLHSGSKTGPKVKNRKQAIAIAMSESGQSKKPTKNEAMKSGSKRKSRNKGRH